VHVVDAGGNHRPFPAGDNVVIYFTRARGTQLGNDWVPAPTNLGFVPAACTGWRHGLGLAIVDSACLLGEGVLIATGSPASSLPRVPASGLSGEMRPLLFDLGSSMLEARGLRWGG